MNNFDMVDEVAEWAQTHPITQRAKPEFIGPTRELRGWELDDSIAEKLEGQS